MASALETVLFLASSYAVEAQHQTTSVGQAMSGYAEVLASPSEAEQA